MPTISVIVPVYKVELYLCRCVDSILNQTYTDFELILVDDGSPDSCAMLCDVYALTDSRVHVIHHPNGGVSGARNAGIMNATGDYVTFVDSDDWIAPDFLMRLLAACRAHNADMALCGYCFATEETTQSPTIPSRNVDLSGRDAVIYYGEENILHNTCHFRAPWAKLICRKLVLTSLFPEDRTYAEDAACIYLWMWQAQKVVGIADELYFYYQNQDGICARPIGMYIKGNFQTEGEWIAFFAEHGLSKLHRLACKRYLDDCVWAIYGAQKAQDEYAVEAFRKILRDGLFRYMICSGISVSDLIRYLSFAYRMLWKTAVQIRKLFS